MEELSASDLRFQSIFLSRNFGHQGALTAALQLADPEEAVFVIDVDLQDPPELLPKFCAKFKEGYEVVYGIRKKRKEGIGKRLAYKLY